MKGWRKEDERMIKGRINGIMRGWKKELMGDNRMKGWTKDWT